MEKDREPAVDAIATWFSTMLDNVGALTSQSRVVPVVSTVSLVFKKLRDFRAGPSLESYTLGSV